MWSCLPSVWPAAWRTGQNSNSDTDDRSIDMESNSNYLLRERCRTVYRGICEFLSIAVIYLVSELLIWGLSLALAPAKLEFFSSVFGMFIVFAIMIIVCVPIPKCDNLYENYIKSKIDFINRHMGVAFAIPMVMLNGGTPMDAKTIGLIIGVFVATTLVAWTVVFVLARLTLFLVSMFSKRIFRILNRASSQQETEKYDNNPSSQTNTFSSNDARAFNNCALRRQPPLWTWLCQFWTLIASFIFISAIGVPLSLVLNDPRILDGSVIWFIWMTAVTLQRTMKQPAKSYANPPTILSILTALTNPVLITILLMTAYTRARAYTLSTNISDVLYRLSSGVQVYTLWTSGVEHESNGAPSQWFGAGDAALSLLGCGFVVWGFKLYECRRQLFSSSGFVTVLVSVAAAAGNVYLSTYVAFIMGLDKAEALAFAARMTTLALAIPAMKNIGGNTSLTVALMITSGILGQLAYPASLNGIEKKNNRQLKRNPSTDSSSSGSEDIMSPTSRTSFERDDVEVDDANTVAAGIAIGINGAAMGVAYLYENKSRSAPYAALAMTTYGVVTVVFIAVNPFKEVLLSLV